MRYFIDEPDDSDILKIIKDDRRLLVAFSTGVGCFLGCIIAAHPDIPVGGYGAAVFGVVIAVGFFIVVRWLFNLSWRRQNRELVALCDREIAAVDRDFDIAAREIAKFDEYLAAVDHNIDKFAKTRTEAQ